MALMKFKERESVWFVSVWSRKERNRRGFPKNTDNKSQTNQFLLNMDAKTAVGTGFVASSPIIHTVANGIGRAKTGAAIGTLHGAAGESATAAWIGLGSMKAGVLMMNAFHIIGGLLILDSLCGPDYGSPIIDWYEEGWKQYEAQCEIEKLKKEVRVDPDHLVTVKGSPSSLAQQEALFQGLEVEHDLYLLKKEVKADPNH